MGFLAWAYKAVQPPPPKICGSADGPPVTAPRIQLSDGRHLAYKEHGVPKEMATHKIVFVHGYDSCRHDAVVAKTLSPVHFHWFIVVLYFYAHRSLDVIFLDLSLFESMVRSSRI